MLGRRAREVEDQTRRRRPSRVRRDLEVALVGLEHVARAALAVGQVGQAGARAPLGVVEDRVGGLRAARRGRSRAASSASRRAPGRVGRELGAQVGAALLGVGASARRGARSPPSSSALRRDHDALVGERAAVGRHRARGADRPRRRGGRGSRRSRAARRPASNAGVMTVMSGRWVPPAKGSLRIHGSAGGVLLAEHGGDRGGHRAEVHGDVLGLHDHLAARVEQRGGGVAALLDVGREGARTSTAPISSQAARSAPVMTWSVIGSTALMRSSAGRWRHRSRSRPPSRAARRASRGRARRPPGPRAVRRRRRAREHLGLVDLAAEDRRRGASARAAGRPPRPRRRARPGGTR